MALQDKPGVKASREAKKLNVELQTYLKTRPLESNDVQFARQQLRRQYMDMLFLPRSQGGVSAPKMLDILSLLWMDTTHALIAKYRAKIAQIDKAIADKPPERGNRGRSKRGGGSQHNAEAGGHQGHVARRRAVQTFRAFLGKEEEYWTQLLVRMINAFRVPQAVPCLTALQISASALTTTRDSLQVDDPEQRAQQVPSKTAILLCHRALVSFGDLVRYRELYQEDVTKKGKKFLTGDESAERPWTKAAECYNQARLLVPEDGQPFNQLAVLASYSNDQLSSVYYYFRAGCVTQDFKTAQPNLEMTLSKALNKYEDSPIDAKAPADQVFMQDFIALQAMIYLQKTDPAVVEAQLDKSLELYKTCLAQRAVSAEAILKIVCTCIAAWHSDRMPHHSNKDSEVQPKPVNEALALRLVLDYLGTTFRESARSVEAMFEGKPPTEPASRDIIASRIAPVLRRSLQAIRCGSKWLLSRSSNGKLATYGAHVSAFWNDYALLVNTFVKRFPTKHLPDLPSDLVLEENIDLCGFLPLGAALKAPKELASALSQGTSSHPNMEHLMRIADILSDAALIASSPATPVSLENRVFSVKFELNPTAQNFRPPGLVDSGPPSSADMSPKIEEDDDSDEDEVLLRDVSGAHLLEESDYHDDSDVIGLAMQAGTTGTHPLGDDQILNPSTASPKPNIVSLPDTTPPYAAPTSNSTVPGSQPASAEVLLSMLKQTPQRHGSPSAVGAGLPRPPSHGSPSSGYRHIGLPPEPAGSAGPSIWGPLQATPSSKELPAPSDISDSAWRAVGSSSNPGAGVFGAAPLRRDTRSLAHPTSFYLTNPGFG